tara:strand:+ start:553 stop:930 length:378 start_codon:yes stop_codon:yes gene_type:complete
MEIEEENLKLNALRGATTCEKNSIDAIEDSVDELIRELLCRNKLIPKRIISIIFSATKDLNVCFPASIARKHNGMSEIALLDCQQMHVDSDLEFCIRILAHAWMPKNEVANHIYLRKATLLRPDR